MPTDRDGCPHLGLRNDPLTRFGFPTLGNYCHRLAPPGLVTPEYQRDWCLTQEFTNCPVYQGVAKEQLPDGLIQKPEGTLPNRNMLLAIGVGAVTIVLLILLVALIGRNRGASRQVRSQTATALAAYLVATPSATNTLLPSPTPTVVPTLTPTGTNTPTVTPTNTPAPPTPGPGLETLFGLNDEFLIHKVATNESLNIIALRYKTSSTVISAINDLREGVSLQVDQFLVILPNQTNVSDLPVFRPLYLEQDASVEAIAQEYRVSARDLIRYNALGDSDLIPAGRWIVIPLPSQ
jgi:LysM repeat protein